MFTAIKFLAGFAAAVVALAVVVVLVLPAAGPFGAAAAVAGVLAVSEM